MFFRIVEMGSVALVATVLFCRWSQSWRSQRLLLERRIDHRSRQLHDSRTIGHRVLDSVPDGIVLTDSAGRVTFTNVVARQVLHLAEGHPAVAWARVSELLGPAPTDDQGHRQRQVKTFITERGEDLVFEITASPLSDVDSGSIHIVRDITRATSVLETKNQFVASVSHEIRTPLTAIVSTLHLIDSGALGDTNDDTRRLVGIASRSADRLMRLVNDVLDHQKLEAGVADMHTHLVTVESFLEVAMSTVAGEADRRNVTLAASGEARASTVVVDPDRMAQVMINLLSNAIKFSDPGAQVMVAVEGRAHGIVRISVIDQCPTIPTALRESIFELFTRVDSTDSRAPEGNGLGLWICHRILERHEGSIWVEPNWTIGNRFVIELPRRIELASNEMMEAS